VLWGLRDPGA
jgi:hypothetical protein